MNRSTPCLAAFALCSLATAQTADLQIERTQLPWYGGTTRLSVQAPAGDGDLTAELLHPNGSKLEVGLDVTGHLDGVESWTTSVALPPNPASAPVRWSVRVPGTGAHGEVVVAPAGHIGRGNGLKATFSYDPDGRGIAAIRQDPAPMLAGSGDVPSSLARRGFAAVWEGSLTPRFSEPTTLHVSTNRRARLLLDGRVAMQGSGNLEAVVPMSAGLPVSFRLELVSESPGAQLEVYWQSASMPEERIPVTQFSTGGTTRPTSRLDLTADSADMKLGARGGMVRATANASSPYGIATLLAEVRDDQGEVRLVPAGQPLWFDANDRESPRTYTVRWLARDHMGSAVAVPGPTVTVAAPETAPVPQPEPIATPSLKPVAAPAEWSGPTTELTAKALQYLGVRYVWGGTDLKSGVDCSGYIQSLFRLFGRRLPRTAAEQALVGTPVGLDALQPGDRLYWWSEKRRKVGHTGLYLGDGWFVHASSSRGKVVRDRFSPYWRSTFTGARR